ncbi:MAG: glucose-1-phosphate adenylyltransferase [Acidobacteriota bacterium]|jgi:glucose-1-phosphate adenylyltransferase|nr:glucose-1-phosphate adenylyltransferase [Acidobacteriota bacterium]
MQDVIGVILGGGQGQRLYPLTKLRSKPAVPLGGKYRLIDIPISNCLNSGINRVFVLTQYNSASLNKHIVQTYKFDMFSGGFVDVLAAEQTPDSSNWFQGTADAVRQSVKHLEPYDARYVVILSGDQLYQMDLRKIVEYHASKGAEVTVAAIRADAQAATGFGIMKLGGDGRVAAFKEKPTLEELPGWESADPERADAGGRDYLGSMGIYVFQKKLLIDLLTESTATDFGREVIPKAIGDHKVFAYPFDGYWEDIGTIRAFYEANLALTDVAPQFNFYDAQRPIFTHRRNLPASKLNNCSVHQAVISEGGILSGADIRHSIVGVRSRIGAGTTVQHSIVMGADYFETVEQLAENAACGRPNIGIGNNCTVINAIVDKNVRIGDGVSIVNAHNLREKDDENYHIRDGIIVIPKGALIRSGTVI